MVFFNYKSACLHVCQAAQAICMCVCVCACARSLNLLHLCLLKYIYMKRQLTFLSCLKPCRPDILLTVAGDILPHFPQEDYIISLLSPLISLSNQSCSFLLCCTPSTSFSSSIYPRFFLPDCIHPSNYTKEDRRPQGKKKEQKSNKTLMPATF